MMTPDMETSPALASGKGTKATVNSCHHLPLMSDKPTVLKAQSSQADLDLQYQLWFLSTHRFH